MKFERKFKPAMCTFYISTTSLAERLAPRRLRVGFPVWSIWEILLLICVFWVAPWSAVVPRIQIL